MCTSTTPKKGHFVRITLKLSLTALLAALTLASALSTASARSLSTTSQTIRVVWAPLQFGNGFTQIRCNVTLEGSLHTRTIGKVLNSLIGYITRANVTQSTCRDAIGGRANAIPWNGTEVILGATIGQSLPWHITYEGFTGTLPNITGTIVLLRGLRFNLGDELIGCLATYGSPTENVKGTLVESAAHVITGLRPGTERIARTAIVSGEGCPESGEFSNEGVVTVLGAATAITVTLI
jgi:hypothetical protein